MKELPYHIGAHFVFEKLLVGFVCECVDFVFLQLRQRDYAEVGDPWLSFDVAPFGHGCRVSLSALVPSCLSGENSL